MKKRRQKAVLFVAVIISTLLLILISTWRPHKPCDSNTQTANTGFSMAAAFQSMEPQDTTIYDFNSSVFQRTPLSEKLVSVIACGTGIDRLCLLFLVFASIGMGVMPLPSWSTPVLIHVRLDE